MTGRSAARVFKGVVLGICFLGGIYGIIFWPRSFILKNSQTCQIIESKAVRSNTVGFFVINLDHSRARWHSIQKHLSSFFFPIIRVSAIYGKSMPEVRQDPKIVHIEKYRKYMKGKEPGLGEIGCYLSHRKALMAFLSSDYDYGVIVEDDVSFAPDIKRVIQDLLTCRTLWDVCTFELHPLQNGWPLPVKSLGSHRNLCIYLKEAWRAGAYLVNRWAAQQLIKKSLPMCLPWDMYYMRFWEFQHDLKPAGMMKFLGVEPRCAFQTFGDSDIEAAGPRQVERPRLRERYLWSGRYFSWCSHATRFVCGLSQWVLWKLSEGVETCARAFSKHSREVKEK